MLILESAFYQNQLTDAHLRRSIQPITSRLSPKVFAASSNLLCVPFNMVRWSTKSSNTALPWAINSSSLLSEFSMKLCSRNACSSRDCAIICGGWLRNGDSDISEELSWVGANRLRVSDTFDGENGVEDELDAPRRSALSAAVF